MKQTLFRHLSNLPGWRTKRKIMVIESDDWGSIRMPSLRTFEELEQAGIDVSSGDSLRYNQNDTLAGAEDLEALYDTLRSIENTHGKRPVFTAVSLVANPDFEKIKSSGFQEYHHELFPNTLERYEKASAMKLWKQGVEEHLFVPEFHGREHLNVAQWMRALQQGAKDTRKAFDYGCWGFKPQNGNTYQAAFYLDQAKDLALQEKAIEEGLSLFKELHGYDASFFVPPNGPINNQLEKVAADWDIQYMSSPKVQYESLGDGQTKRHFRWLGKQNQHGQRYITRNAFFEPNSPGKDRVGGCLKEIEIAFQWGKPAIISSHRANYIGSLREQNRKEGLKGLHQLLSSICKRWPQVEFMTSPELGALIRSEKEGTTE